MHIRTYVGNYYISTNLIAYVYETMVFDQSIEENKWTELSTARTTELDKALLHHYDAVKLAARLTEKGA